MNEFTANAAGNVPRVALYPTYRLLLVNVPADTAPTFPVTSIVVFVTAPGHLQRAFRRRLTRQHVYPADVQVGGHVLLRR